MIYPIENNHIQDRGVIHLIKAIEENTSLKLLNLCKILN